jgi:membrane protein YqaA with SNARE-associated domain
LCAASSTAAGEGPGETELRSYVRRSLFKAVLLLAALVTAVGVGGLLYEAELLAATTWVFDTIGLFGLMLILFVSDALITPIPPDLVLVVLSNSWVHQYWGIAVGLIGLLSSLAGNVAWLLSTRVGGTRWATLLFGRFRRTNQRLVARYGKWAVALGALTPIPFSVTCWTAGLLDMPWREFGPVTLLRLPRFVGYYVAIAYADDLARLFV